MSVSSDASVRPNSNHGSGQLPGQLSGTASGSVYGHPETLSDVERHILATIRNIRFGTLEIVIHDSRIVQVERSEKTRFDVRGKPLSESIS